MRGAGNRGIMIFPKTFFGILVKTVTWVQGRGERQDAVKARGQVRATYVVRVHHTT